MWLWACFRYFYALVQCVEHFFRDPSNGGRVRYPDNEDEDDPPLAVLIHGLMGSPSELQPLVDAVPANYSVLCPWVRNRGNCPLRDAVDCLMPSICQYIKDHPNAPVVLIGYSNGGRVAAQIAILLRERGHAVKLITVCTPFLGTPWFEWDICCTLMRLRGYLREVINELRPGSRVNRDLVYELMDGSLTSQNVFFVARHDFKVPGRYDDTPLAKYPRVLEHDGHLSAVHAVAPLLSDIL